MKNTFLLLIAILSFQLSFSQCDEYYINELISGNDEKCYFEGGTKIRFCPNLKGMAIGQLTLDISQWSGVSTQYITVTKNGGIAGTLVLKLIEKELLVNLNGCGEARKYSISLNKSELQDFYAKKDNTLIEQINSHVSKKEYEKAFELTSKLMQKSNYSGLSELEKLCNEQRLFNYRILISKTKEEINSKNYIVAAKFISEIKLPTNLDWAETNNYRNCKSAIESELINLYKDSVIFVNTNFQFSTSNAIFEINNKKISFDQEILNHLDSLSDGNYFLRITKTLDRYNREVLNYDILGKKFGIQFNYENGSLWLTCTPGWPASKLGLPTKIKIKSIDGKTFTNSADPLTYIGDRETIVISYWDSLLNTYKEQIINRGLTKLASLPGNQKSCNRWMQGGGCVDYYTANLIEGWSIDSLKNLELGIFNLSVANLIPFKLESKIENPTIEYYTKTGETLKIVNESFYRKVKGQKSLKLITILDKDVSNNTVMKSQTGNCKYFINDKVNFTEKNIRINTSFPIIDLLPKSD
jgi:hypothetical protein